MEPISGMGDTPHSTPSQYSPQQEEILTAVDDFLTAFGEASSGQTLSPQTYEQCKDSLQAIINDPNMSQANRQEATQLLSDFEGNPNDKGNLLGIVTELKAMFHGF